MKHPGSALHACLPPRTRTRTRTLPAYPLLLCEVVAAQGVLDASHTLAVPASGGDVAYAPNLLQQSDNLRQCAGLGMRR